MLKECEELARLADEYEKMSGQGVSTEKIENEMSKHLAECPMCRTFSENSYRQRYHWGPLGPNAWTVKN